MKPQLRLGAALSLSLTNIGLEGVCWDPLHGKFLTVKEKTPQGVFENTIDWGVPSASVVDLFVPNLQVLDLSDVQALTTVPSLIGTDDQDNLLIYSQESSKLMEVTRSGEVLSTFDFTAIASDAEGVTIGPDGTVYVVGETPALYVLTPIPVPCPEDVTGNHVIDIDDLVVVITSWSDKGGPADITGNGVVNIDDLVLVITHWGSCP